MSRTRSVRSLGSCLGLGLTLFAVPREAVAQFGNAWLKLTQQSDVLVAPGGAPADLVVNTDEKDFAVGDLDRDGWIDLVVVKSAPVTFPGPREGRLFLNEKGKLVDRTATHGIQSLSAGLGDLGFQHAVDSSDVEIGDLDGDGWDDVLGVQYDLTNNTSPGAKRLTHPRVYRNLGVDGQGDWLGIRHEDARIPQLLTVGGLNGVVRFMDGSLGDIDGDGDLDLYFSDFDTNMNGHSEPSNLDLNDRLLINDGNGYFTDETVLRFANTGMWSSAYGTQNDLRDLNGDGKDDIVKISTLTDAPNRVEVIYNDLIPGTLPDFFGGFDSMLTISPGENYEFALNDLNNDGRLDIAVGDFATDHYLFNVGNDSLGRVVWSPQLNFTWLTGSGEDGFMGAMYSHDYDLDGWNDVLITDIDVDLPGCNRRTKIYHNRGGAQGATNIVLAEEKQQSGSGGWFGAVGWSGNSPRGVFDAANIDYDRDGDLDIVLGRCVGTEVWRNETNPIVCQPTVAPASLGNASLSICGAPLYSNLTSVLAIAGGPPGGLAVLLASTTSATAAFFGAQVLIPFQFAVQVPILGDGTVRRNVPGGGGPPSGFTFYVQALLLPAIGGPPTHVTEIVAATVFD